MRQIDIEREIKRLIEEDVTNPEIYNKIKELAYVFLRRNKLMLNAQEAEEVSYIVAEELYLKVYNGGEINSWIGYINRAYQAYIRVWRNMNRSELIDVNDNYELEQAIVGMSASTNTSRDYQMVVDRIYFESLPKIVDIVIDESRFNKYSSSSLNSRLSILLSLCSGKFMSYNQEKEDEMYTRMLYTQTRDRIAKTLRQSCEQEEDRLTLLQLFNISTLDNNE